MISYSYIRNNVRSINSRYVKSKTTQDASYYSKLAILELCGWIEISLDEALLNTGNRILKNPKSKKFLEEKIRRIYGFDYENHLTTMIVSLIGISGFERVEKSIDIAVLVNFKSELSILKERRNSLAHTYTRGATVHYDAPSITLARFERVAAGIKAYDTALRAIC